MFDVEEISLGFHDVFLSKYSDSSGPNLDFYISDSMQDMLDIDIISEVATVIGGVNDISSLMSDLPTMDFDTSNDDLPWSGGPIWSATSDIYADVGACINPNSVHSQTPASISQASSILTSSPKAQLNLNVNNYQNANSPLPSPKEKKSHLTFSPNTIKVPLVIHQQQDKKQSSLLSQHQQQHHHQLHQRTNVDSIKKDLSDELKEEKHLKPIISSQQQHTTIASNNLSTQSNTIKLAPGIGGLTFANSLMYAKLKQNNGKIVTNGNINILKRDNSTINHHSINQINSGSQSNPQKIFTKNIIVQNGKPSIATMHQNHINGHSQTTTNIIGKIVKPKAAGSDEFPKPAYSYSCLIAMALKNSRAGSLPVSEIYSFMCEHFPYFKTAPNGWKNSVRHNLSLNKCFEKIEKPATNGGQRKGCLWAMNPSKIIKMDEEIQKWSRKDPMAIRKAMVYPDNLEMLERGEMKHGSTGDSEGENDTEDMEENSDSDPEGEIDDTALTITEAESAEDEEEDPNSQMDFDVEVNELYDEISINDGKEIHLNGISQKTIFELTEDELPSPKRARLDINYSIGPAGAFAHLNGTQQQQQQQQQQQSQQNRRKMTLINRIV